MTLPHTTLIGDSSRRQAAVSSAQRRLWFVDHLGRGDSHEYNLTDALRLRGAVLDVAALRRAVDTIVERHEILRTGYRLNDGELVAAVEPPAPVAFLLEDLSPLDPVQQIDRVRAIMREERAQPFDLARPPLVRVRVLRCGPGDHVFVRTFHHIAFDGWSRGVFNRECATLYEAFREGRANPLDSLPAQYAEYAAREQRTLASGPDLEDGLAYWRRQLAGLPDPIALPTDRPRTPGHEPAQAYRVTVSEARVENLRRLSRANHATLYMTLLAAFGVVLAEYTGQDDLVIGSPVANRPDPSFAGLIGCFANSLPMRVRVQPQATFRELLAEVRRTTIDAFQRQHVPFDTLVERLSPPRGEHVHPIFQVTFALQNATWTEWRCPSLAVDRVQDENDTNLAFDLSLHAVQRDRALELSWRYQPAICDRELIERMAARYGAILDAAVSDASPVSRWEIVGADERQTLSAAVGHTASQAACTALTLWERMAAVQPHSTAVRCDEVTVSYGQLARIVNGIAGQLVAHGVGRGTAVGVCVERTAILPAYALAVWKAGGVYVPLDPREPTDRLKFLAGDSAIAIVVTEPALRLQVAPLGLPSLAVDPSSVERLDAAEGASPIAAGDLAYVMYTSGSTGLPKGVRVEHRSISHYIQAMNAALPRTFDRTCLQTASLGFSSSIRQLVLPLSSGGTVVVASDDARRDGRALVDYILAIEAEVLDLVPTMWAEVIRECERRRAAGIRAISRSAVRVMLSASEPLSSNLASRWLGIAGDECALWNMYGQTETTGIVAIHPLGRSAPRGSVVPIGRPIGASKIFVLDRHLRCVPPGVIGEIHIAGPALARGYTKRDLTADRFIAGPRDAGEVLYRTGDRGRYGRDGVIEFCGRVDRQMKVRGVRVELGEIEAQLKQHPGVADAAAVGHSRAAADRIDAYVIPARRCVTPDQLRAFLKTRLPSAMIPHSISFRSQWPLTSSGKIDRAALVPVAHATAPIGSIGSPQLDLLCALFADALDRNTVAPDDDFFALGGHSLLATRLVSTIVERCGADVSVSTLFEHPTPRQLFDVLEASRHPGDPLSPRNANEVVPLSRSQEHIWRGHRQPHGAKGHHLVGALRLTGTLDTAALQRAIETIVERHEILRTRYAVIGGEVVTTVEPPASIAVAIEDLASLGEAQQRARIHAAMHDESTRPFDLAYSPLLRVRLLRCTPDEHLLIRTMHSIAADAWSQVLFNRECVTLYEAFREGRANPLAPLPLQYGDYAIWEQRTFGADRTRADDLSYWRQELSSRSAPIRLRKVCGTSQRTGSAADVYRSRIGSAELAALHAFSRAQHVSLNMTLFAAFGVVLGEHTGQHDLVIGSPVANRRHPAVEGLIGRFAQLLPLRLRLRPAQTFEQVLDAVRHTTLAALHHQFVPPDEGVDSLPVTFDLQFASALPSKTLTAEPFRKDRLALARDLELQALVRENELTLAWRYRTSVFEREPMAALASAYHTLLRAVVADSTASLDRLAVRPAKADAVCQ